MKTVEHHVHEEEHEVFDKAEEVLDSRLANDLKEQMHNYKKQLLA